MRIEPWKGKLPTILIVFFIVSIFLAPQSWAAELQVSVTGMESSDGAVTIRIYSGDDGWLKDEAAITRQSVSLENWSEGSTVSASFELDPGEYAVAAYQDEDSDGELDSNFIGIPKEPAGLSNKPKARMGPPKYADAAFELTEEGLSVPVELN